MKSIRKLGLAASAVAIGGAALGVGLSAGTAHAQSASSISFVSATTTYSSNSFAGTALGSDQAVLTFSVTCPAVPGCAAPEARRRCR
jgi:fumarate hydratase class II